MLAAIEQQIFELPLTRINSPDREIKIHGRHMNRVNRHVEENRERVRCERRGYHRKVIDNTKINLRRNVTNPVDSLIYDATAVRSTIARASRKVSKKLSLFFSTISLSFYLPNNAKTAIEHFLRLQNNDDSSVMNMCIIFKRKHNLSSNYFFTQCAKI